MKVRYFAGIQEKLGVSEEEIDPVPTTLTELKAVLLTRHPELRDTLEKSRIAVNLEFVSMDRPLGKQDEVAIIPPVSGG
jgi:molybdopterin converting factor subunit 1